MDGPGTTVTVGDSTLDAEDLLGAAAAVAERVHGGPVVAVHATASLRTVFPFLLLPSAFKPDE